MGLITDAEWDVLREPFRSCVQVLTLVPVDIAAKAIAVFGETARSAALVQALGYGRPSEWDEGEVLGEEEDEEGDGLEDEEDDDDDEGGSDSGEHNGDRSDGGVSIAATEQFEHNEDGDEAAAEGGGDGGGGGGDGEGQLQSLAKKTRVATYTLLDVPPARARLLLRVASQAYQPRPRRRQVTASVGSLWIVVAK